MNKNYIPVAENVSHLQRQKDAKGEFFRNAVSKGHYRSGGRPTDTKQGLYAIEPSGELITSVNSTKAGRVLRLLTTAQKMWNDGKDKRATVKVENTYQPDKDFHYSFPKDGMALACIVRDLPRDTYRQPDLDRFNLDHAWLTNEEFKTLVPEKLEKGAKAELDKAALTRICRHHLVDAVNGEPHSYDDKEVVNAKLVATVADVSEKKIKLILQGSCLMKQPPTKKRNPYTGRIMNNEMGTELMLAGFAVFDREKNTFTSFDFVAIGNRWGEAVYNFRSDDMGPAPIGFAFRLSDSSDPNRLVAPKSVLWGYF